VCVWADTKFGRHRARESHAQRKREREGLQKYTTSEQKQDRVAGLTVCEDTCIVPLQGVFENLGSQTLIHLLLRLKVLVPLPHTPHVSHANGECG
jgi:hypothetical protein